jgi:hypothetical protein
VSKSKKRPEIMAPNKAFGKEKNKQRKTQKGPKKWI